MKANSTIVNWIIFLGRDAQLMTAQQSLTQVRNKYWTYTRILDKRELEILKII
jgi:hypothetical protein